MMVGEKKFKEEGHDQSDPHYMRDCRTSGWSLSAVKYDLMQCAISVFLNHILHKFHCFTLRVLKDCCVNVKTHT